MSYNLSILIPSIDSRRSLLSELVCDLIRQCGEIKAISNFSKLGCTVLSIGFDDVEIIIAIDNKQIPTGTKRQMLLELSNNTHIVFIDCDDYVYPYYVSEMVKAIQTNPDCVAINGIYTIDGTNPIQWFLSKDNPNTTITIDGKFVYLRTTNHITAVKRELALLAGFPPLSIAEDKMYSTCLNSHLKVEVVVTPVMYHYRYNSKNREY